MARKDTVHTHRHISEEKEIKRIIQYYKEEFNLTLTILEASAIAAKRSLETFWTKNKALKEVQALRGFI